MKVLIWLEPYPLRNSYVDFAASLGGLFSDLKRNLKESKGFEVKIFSNNEALIHLSRNGLFDEAELVWPTNAEQLKFESFHVFWNEESVATWKDYLTGGMSDTFPADVVQRVVCAEKPDVVLSWSHSRGLHDSVTAAGVPIVYLELGPTRPPFKRTLYFDFHGLGPRAGIRHFAVVEDGLSKLRFPSPRVSEKFSLSPEMSLRQLTLDQFEVLGTGYAVLPMQLADDSNLVLDERFADLSDFVEWGVRQITSNGLTALVRPHPGAKRTSFASRAQRSALKAIREYTGVLIHGETIAPDYLTSLLHSRYVLTLNSSVGFENLLLGGETRLVGKAPYAFDFGTEQPDITSISWDGRSEWLSKNWLIEDSPKSISEGLATVIEFVASRAEEDQRRPQKLWEDWGDSRHEDASVRELSNIQFEPKIPDKSGKKRGIIEEYAASRKAGGKVFLTLRGWVLDGDEPPESVALQVGKRRILSTERFRTRRGLATSSQFAPRCFFVLKGFVDELDISTVRVAIRFASGQQQLVRIKTGHMFGAKYKIMFFIINRFHIDKLFRSRSGLKRG